MPDLTPLTQWLATLGPWGYVLAAAIPIAAYFLKQRFKPADPTLPQPTPDPSIPTLAAKYPLLDAILKALGMAPKGRSATVADLPHELQVKLRAELDSVDAHKVAIHTAALADLTRPAEGTFASAPPPK